MFDIFGNLRGLLKVQSVCIDNNIFRLHYQATMIALVLFCILVGSRQYFGDPIDCTSNPQTSHVIDNYCWMHSYIEPHDTEFSKHEAHPGITHYEKKGKIFQHYYQWVGFVLFFQAVLFFIPRYLWRYCWEEGKIKGLALGMRGPSVDYDKEAQRKKMILDYLHRNIGNHNLYFFRYVVCEILNLINVVSQMFIMDAFLGYTFTTYGKKSFSLLNMRPSQRDDLLSLVFFPKVAKCDFTYFASGGKPVTDTVLCVLPVNIFNEKIYVFLWFWFIILMTLTSLSLCYRVMTLFVPNARAYILHRKTRAIDLETTKTIVSGCSVGDWFLLYQIGKNVDPCVFGDLLKDYSRRFELHEANIEK